MVKAVGCDIYSGDLVLYDYNLPHTVNNLKIKAPGPDDNVNFIEEFLQEVSKKIKGIIDCFCVMMGASYKNEFRKKFIKICETQKNIKNVKIIGYKETILLGAIENLSFLPEINDILWIFDCRENMIYSILWIFNEEHQWKFVQAHSVEKTFKNLDKSPTVEDLQKLKSKIKKLPKIPYIYVLHDCVINENDFKNVFPDYKKFVFEENYDWAGWALIYARYFLNDEKYVNYKSDVILDRYLEIKKMDSIYFRVSGEQILPFSETIIKYLTVFNKNDVIKVYENIVETDKISVEEGENSITLEIDINGIYTIKVVNLEKQYEYKAIQNNIYSIPKKISDYNPEMHAVGIDLGTTECCAAVIRKNGPDFVVLDPVTGLRTMPSYVAFDEKEPKCGQIVIDRMRHYAKYTVYDSKRIIGRYLETIAIDPLWPFKISKTSKIVTMQVETYNGIDNKKSPEEISGILLYHIKKITEDYEGTVLTEAVITIPTEFSEKQKQATKTAAEMAGWKTVHFIPEPIAAAFAYFTEIKIPDNSNILICDCGGGTVDICVAKISDGKLEILSYDGDPYLGGRDFDKLLFNHFSAVLKHKYGFDVMKSSKRYILRQKCQDMKHKLSAANEVWLDVDDFDSTVDGIIKITKEEFEEMASALLVRLNAVVLQTVSNANISKNSINYVFQVGGGCRMPMIKEMLKEIFPQAKHECNLYPDWVVAHGAALYAYHLKSQSASEVKPSIPKNTKNDEKSVAQMKKMFERL